MKKRKQNTGNITSILFGVPGEANTASTIVAGHPMAKKGEAGRALGAALMSSLVDRRLQHLQQHNGSGVSVNFEQSHADNRGMLLH